MTSYEKTLKTIKKHTYESSTLTKHLQKTIFILQTTYEAQIFTQVLRSTYFLHSPYEGKKSKKIYTAPTKPQNLQTPYEEEKN